MADTIGINTPNPNDITLEEVEEIAEAVRRLNLNCEVTASGQHRTGIGVTWFQVLRIVLLGGGAFGMAKAFTEEVAKKIADIVVEWARERIRGRKSASKRPVYVAIYGPDGTVKSLVIRNATDEPEDRTEQDQHLERAVKARLEKDNLAKH
jgi:RNA 3'-terminal phosphate cyclase